MLFNYAFNVKDMPEDILRSMLESIGMLVGARRVECRFPESFSGLFNGRVYLIVRMDGDAKDSINKILAQYIGGYIFGIEIAYGFETVFRSEGNLEIPILFCVPEGTPEDVVRSSIHGLEMVPGVNEVDLLMFSPTTGKRWQFVIVVESQAVVATVLAELQQYRMPEQSGAQAHYTEGDCLQIFDVHVYFSEYVEVPWPE